jgi:hypothetical protein
MRNWKFDMTLIDEANESELREAMHSIADLYCIGKAVRHLDMIVINATNAREQIRIPTQAVISEASRLPRDSLVARFIGMFGVLMLILTVGCNERHRNEMVRAESSRLKNNGTITVGNRTNVTLVSVDGVEYVVVHRSWSEGGVAITPHVRP